MAFLKNENDYLIHLIRCVLENIKPEELPEGLSFERVYQTGKEHEVANIAFYGIEKLEKKPHAALYEKWENTRNLSISRDFNQAFAKSEIIHLFEENKIESIEIQGTEMKKLYPKSEYRTMSDIDFIIKKEKLPRAKEILERLGYKCTDVHEVEVDAERAPNIFVEIHTEYFPVTDGFYGVLPEPFSTNESNDVNIFYAYNILHVAKHYYSRGCGIRRILDVYILNKSLGNVIDKEYVGAIFEKAKMTTFVRNISALAECWFEGREVPGHLNNMVEYLIGAGVHGTAQNLIDNYLRKNFGEKKRFIKVRYFFKKAFPKKDSMLKHYPILSKRKILYPFCYIHRLVTGIFNSSKRKNAIADAKMVMKSNTNKEV